MKAVVVELRDNMAAVLQEDGSVVAIENKGYQVGKVVQMKETVRQDKRKIWPWAAAAAVLLSVGGTGMWAYATPYSYVSLDVNPSIEYTLNRFDQVLQVRAVNDDGEEIVEELELQNLGRPSIEAAVVKTVEKLTEQGYFDGEEPGELMIATSGKNQQRAEKLAETLEAEVGLHTSGRPVEVESVAVGAERVQEAHALGVTPGKLHLVEELQQAADHPEEIDLEEWLKKPVKEIQKATQAQRQADKKDKEPDLDGSGEDTKEGPNGKPKPETKADKIQEQADQRTERVEEKFADEPDKAASKVDRIEEKSEEKVERTERKDLEKDNGKPEDGESSSSKPGNGSKPDKDKEKENGSGKDKTNNGQSKKD